MEKYGSEKDKTVVDGGMLMVWLGKRQKYG